MQMTRIVFSASPLLYFNKSNNNTLALKWVLAGGGEHEKQKTDRRCDGNKKLTQDEYAE